MNSTKTGNKSLDKHIKMGMGFGGGFLMSIPITDMITFVPEANFLYRTLFNIKESEEECYYTCVEYKLEISASELALSFPLMVQFAPIAGTPIYFAGGVQIDVPFLSKIETKVSFAGESESDSDDFEDRSVDFGIAFGSGWRMSNFGLDFKVVIGMNSLTSESGDDSSLTQYGVGVSVFF
jgi:hypothetical protein